MFKIIFLFESEWIFFLIVWYCKVVSRCLVNEGCFWFLGIFILNDLSKLFVFGDVIGNDNFVLDFIFLRKENYDRILKIKF